MKVAIVGYGVEGESAYKYFANKGADITIFDENEQPKFAVPEGVSLVAGKGALDKLHGYDVVMRVPALRPERLKTDGKVSSVVQEFFNVCPAPIIGVTGSKGKGTITTLIFDMLKNAGKNPHVAGNIGIPALDILPSVQAKDVVVLELSSFQLWDVTKSPHVAVIGMMEPEHLDVHKDVEEYMAAKASIVKWQDSSDVTVYLPGNTMTETVALQGKGKKIPYTKNPGAHIENGNFMIDGIVICKTSELGIPGEHNVQNTCAAITAAWQFTQDRQAIATAIREFKGLDHRLKFVAEVNGVKYFDDSIGTTPGSSIAAINAFAQPKVLILGGADKGADFTELAHHITKHDVRAVVAVGTMRTKIIEALKKAHFVNDITEFDQTSSMEQIVKKCAELALSGDVVILSPACTSFDMFKDYKERGQQFIAAVKQL
ncbi:MAG TPA: UDP-N-acetylmuramoyl-L-alanine--D-glutamate ligase [Candidatus Saccharimonadales bacterium]|nr:UDP-N-acetylmuramoyl-L-alanine--D-glutamate ligase [Candidatus Saccharimonadales bacterium]